MKILSTKVVYENRWMKVREDELRRNSGHKGIYGVVEKPDFALIIPFDGEYLYLVEQFRYPVSERFWEFPQGSWEDDQKVEPLRLAQGELKEETGLSADKMTYLGYLYPSYGFASQGMHVFLATELTCGNQELEQEEHDLIVKKFALAEVENMIRTNVIKDAASVAAWALWKLV